MEHVPDAPYIRDAENNGVGDDQEYKCPICYAVCEKLFTTGGKRDVVGCENCLTEIDPWEYYEEEEGF